jgi:hypothetical protein
VQKHKVTLPALRDSAGHGTCSRVRIAIGLFVAAAALAFQAAQAPPAATIREVSHLSQVLGQNRTYRVFLPPSYAASQKRYPVIYWFHGYEQSDPQRESDLASYVGGHDVVLVDLGPVETTGSYPLYFPELVEQVDKTLRTFPDRDHRAVTGFSTGGFMAFWIAGKYPDLIGSASSIMGNPEAFVGPHGFEVEYSHDDFYGNYAGVRTRLVTGTRDFMRAYHQRLNGVWLFARANHETESFDSAHGAPGIAKTLDFHMHAFESPLPKPTTFSHADAYPNFAVWGWEVASERRQPGFTVLQDVSSTGFRSCVREWLPSGAAMPEVKLSIASPARLYVPGSVHPVTYIRVRDGKLRRTDQKADAQGRLNFEIDGDDWEVGVSPGPLIAVSAAEVQDAAWAPAGKPVKLRVKFWNKGAAKSGTVELKWESSNAGVSFESAAGRLFALSPGESATVPLTFTVDDPQRAIVQIAAVQGSTRLTFEVPLFPPAAAAPYFQIADGRTVSAYQHAVDLADMRLGAGNADGHAAPGESFAVLLPDGNDLRAAELFTNDPCVDNTLRPSDSWADYDRAGASVKYSLPSILPGCQPGHVVHMLARVVVPAQPDFQVKYWSIELPVWWRKGEEPSK